MDIFDQYLFEKLVSEYNRPDLTDDDYEELYIRFCNLDYLEEVKPYLLVMRFLGLGITAEADAALSELKQIMGNNTELTGLYYDLKLCANPQNTEVIVELRRSIEDGYCGRYLKDRSNIALVEKAAKEEKGLSAPMINNTVVDDKIYYRSMNFEGCGYSGLYFTSGDIDFLHAKVFIEPMNATRKITVLSQIFAGDEPFSKVFSDEIMLKPGDTWFTTTGWGNKNFNCYGNRVYRWVIEFDGNENDVHSQDFRFYNGKIKKYGVPINDIKLFASKSSVRAPYFDYQYMGNIQAPCTEGTSRYSTYKKLGVLDSAITFIIPVYDNMPDSAAAIPPVTGNPNSYIKYLSINNGSIGFNQTFTYNKLNYNAVTRESSINISATPVSSYGTIVSGAGYHELNPGNNVIQVVCQAGNGTQTTYTLNIYRQ